MSHFDRLRITIESGVRFYDVASPCLLRLNQKNADRSNSTDVWKFRRYVKSYEER